MMLRIDALRAIYPLLRDRLVVTIMGAVAAELYSLGHRPNFFYLQHAMGLAPSIGLGLALCLPRERVVVLDGDGSALMNLGGLTTTARYRPTNLVHVIFDNESLLSVGGFPTATATGADLAGIARAAGFPHAAGVRTVGELGTTLTEALGRDELTCIVAKVDAVAPTSFHMDLALLENRFEFARAVRARAGAPPEPAARQLPEGHNETAAK
jgi:sulfopyruvate decarboxylase subunit beta